MNEKQLYSLSEKLESGGKLLVEDFLNVFNPIHISRFSMVLPCLNNGLSEMKLQEINDYTFMLKTMGVLYEYCIENNIYLCEDSFKFIRINEKIYIEINKSVLTKETNSDFIMSYVMCLGDYVFLGDLTITVKCIVLDEILSGRFRNLYKSYREKDFFIKQDELKKNRDQKTYIMFDSNTGYHKIGKSISATKREKTLQSEKPTIKLVLICEENIESYLHKKYSEKRIRGEWFDLDADDLLELIEIYNFKKH